MSTEELIDYFNSRLRDGWIVVEYVSTGVLMDFENILYRPGTTESANFEIAFVQKKVGETSVVQPLVIAKKTPLLRRFLANLSDPEFDRLSNIQLIASSSEGMQVKAQYYDEKLDRIQLQLDLATWLVTGRKEGTLAEDN